MPRKKRLRVPGYVLHITCRCHKHEYLLKFKKDRLAWRYWLYQARKRYGLRVLNYIVTSNHIHLMVVAPHKREVALAMQLVSGRTAQAYNARKERRGAFWEDRYRVTVIEKNEHLVNCMVYVDLNMVRAGVVQHPEQWDVCAYNEIHSAQERYRVLSWEDLLAYFGFSSKEAFREAHADWIDDALFDSDYRREPVWTESAVVGSEHFVTGFRDQLGAADRNKRIQTQGEVWALREADTCY